MYPFSLYQLVRLIILAFPFVAAILLGIRFRGEEKKKQGAVIPLMIFIVALMFLFRLPFENLFVTYSSPQNALHYVIMDGEVIGSVNGKTSSLIIYSRKLIADKEKELLYYTESILPKTKKGWKIIADNRLSASADCLKQDFGGYQITLAKPKRGKIKDYYVIIYYYHVVECDIVITDSAGSNFQKFAVEYTNKNGIAWWYAYIEYLNEDYVLIIDGEHVKIDNLHEWLVA